MVNERSEADGEGKGKGCGVKIQDVYCARRTGYPSCDSSIASFIVLLSLLSRPDFQDKAAYEQTYDAPDVIGKPGDIAAEVIRHENTETRDDQDEQ